MEGLRSSTEIFFFPPFLKNGKNYNYYDDKGTLEYFKPLIYKSIQTQMNFPNIQKSVATVGQGKNLDFLQRLNGEKKLFSSIKILPHPRWIMQYRRKDKQKYIKQYIETLKKISN